MVVDDSIMVSALTESNAVDVGELVYKALPTIKEIPSITSFASSVDDEVDQVNTLTAAHASESRDGLLAACFAEKLCIGPNLFLSDKSREENRDDEGVSANEESLPKAAPLAVLPDSHVNSSENDCESDENSAFCHNQCASPVSEHSPKAATVVASPGSHVNSPENDCESDVNSAFWYNMCASPISLFNSANNDNDIDDGKSFGSISIVGNLFDDLVSLPSVSAFGFQALSSGKKEEGDVDTAVSLIELSTMLDTEKDDTALVAGATEMNDEAMEKAIELKLSELDLDKKAVYKEIKLAPVRSVTTPIRGKTAFLRSNSAPVWRTRKTGASETANVAASSQSSRWGLAQELRAARDTYGRYDLKCANIMLRLADTVYEEGDYERALTVYKEAWSIYSTKLGDIHITTIDSNVHVGETLLTLGRYDEAIQVFYNVLEKRQDLNGDEDSSVADALVLISRALQHKTGRLPQALKELKRALRLYRTSLGDKHPKVSATVDDIAALYMMNGNFAKAALILDEVVKLKAATNGMFNADVAASLTQLGTAQQSSGETANALKSMKKAYTVYVSIEGENGEQAILVLERIAGIFSESKDHKKAINAYMAVLKGKKMKMKDTHPSVAATYMDLGLCLRDKGDLDKATKCLKQSLTIYVADKTLSNVENVAQAMRELGIVHHLRGHARDAVKVFKQELAIRRKIGPSESPQVARTLFYLGTAKYDQKDYPAALSFLTESLAMYEKLDDDLGPDYAETLLSTGLVFKATRHVDGARQAFLESVKLFHAHGLGNDHELVKMAATKLKELGHKCECEGGGCNQVPCKTSYGTINC